MVTVINRPLRWIRNRPTWQWIAALILTFATWAAFLPASFMNFWLTNNQQGHVYFEQGDYAKAQASFDSPQWKAKSAYLAGDFQNAVTLLKDQQQLESQFLLANVYAYSNQYQQAKILYIKLSKNPSLKTKMKHNIDLMNAAIEKQKNAPLEKQEAEKMIDDRNIATSEEEASTGTEVELSDQVWLKQVRQDPSKFLRQKFQQEYANEQE